MGCGYGGRLVFLEVGFDISEVPIKLIKIMDKVSVEDGSKYISFEKSNVSLEIDFEIKYSNSFIGNQKNKIMDKIPMKKFGSPDDIANLALFLSSDLSTYITGQTFHVNGGMLMV